MDPNATWKTITEALENGNNGEAVTPAIDLLDWLRRGGFPPHITGRAALDGRLAQIVCMHIID